MNFVAVEAEARDVKLHAISVLRATTWRTGMPARHRQADLLFRADYWPIGTAKLNQQLTASPFFLAGANLH